jgi:pilus assembly protein CpaE
MVLGEPGPTQQQIVTALDAEDKFEFMGSTMPSDRLIREIRSAEPNIILVDQISSETSMMDMIDSLVSQFPGMAIVAILPDDDPMRAQQVMLAGARAFIVQPFTQANLLSTLRRVQELEARRQLHHQSGVKSKEGDTVLPLKMITVFSPRGGVGCTTLASNLAMAIFEETDQKVLLLEGKQYFGHLAVMLNIRSQSNLADLVPHVSSLDENLVKEVIVEHASGIHILLGPTNFQVAQGVRPEDLYPILKAVERLYDYIVIDAGSNLSENAVTIMDTTDRILIVTTPDMASLHDASQLLQITQSLAYPQDKTLVVLNKSDMVGGIKSKHIETALHQEIFSRIPFDGPNAQRSVNRGIPMILRYPRSPATKAIQDMARKLIRMRTAESTQPTDGSSRKRTGFLSRATTKQPA